MYFLSIFHPNRIVAMATVIRNFHNNKSLIVGIIIFTIAVSIIFLVTRKIIIHNYRQNLTKENERNRVHAFEDKKGMDN